MADDAAFIVRDPESGHEYKIWADGRIEGFGSATIVVNRIPLAVERAVGGRKVVGWRYQRKEGWGEVWRLTDIDPSTPGFLQTPDDWRWEPVYAD